QFSKGIGMDESIYARWAQNSSQTKGCTERTVNAMVGQILHLEEGDERKCPNCGNTGSMGHIFAVLNDMYPLDYTHDVLIAGCLCTACRATRPEHATTERDIEDDDA